MSDPTPPQIEDDAPEILMEEKPPPNEANPDCQSESIPGGGEEETGTTDRPVVADEESATNTNPKDEHIEEMEEKKPAATTTAVSEVVESLLVGGSFSETPVLPSRQQIETKTSDEPTPAPPTLFVNHGLARWESNRNEWLRAQNSQPKRKLFAKELNVDDIIDTLFATSVSNSKVAFPENVPLAQMVDVLQDLWEAEGLDV